MHAKMLLFDMDQKHAMLWIGSHNATQRALFGVNIEASILIKLERTSTLYKDAEQFIESVRERCTLMDPNLTDYYKWLQSGAELERAIELEDELDKSAVNETFTLFGSLEEDYQQLSKVNRQVLVSLTAQTSHRERLYWGRVVQTGELAGHPSLDFSPRRYAYRKDRRLPVLLKPAAIPHEVRKNSYYFVTLKLERELPPESAAYAPLGKAWVETKGEALTQRLETLQIPTGRGSKPPRLYRAAPPEAFRRSDRDLVKRRAEHDRMLVTRVALVTPEE
jgi:hypothetical protein